MGKETRRASQAEETVCVETRRNKQAVRLGFGRRAGVGREGNSKDVLRKEITLSDPWGW